MIGFVYMKVKRSMIKEKSYERLWAIHKLLVGMNSRNCLAQFLPQNDSIGWSSIQNDTL